MVQSKHCQDLHTDYIDISPAYQRAGFVHQSDRNQAVLAFPEQTWEDMFEVGNQRRRRSLQLDVVIFTGTHVVYRGRFGTGDVQFVTLKGKVLGLCKWVWGGSARVMAIRDQWDDTST
jgi:hypothetical protein